MKRGKGLVIVFVLLSFLTLNAQTNEGKKGMVTFADGQVKRQTIALENWQDAPVNTNILTGDKVRTYQDSRAELDLAQIDIIRLAPRTTVDIVKLYEETQEKKIQTEIKVESGELWASVQKVQMNAEFDVSTPIAAAAITGTTLRFKVGADSTTQLKVYTGEVHITNAPGKTDLKPQSLIPRQVPGPYQVPGPREVSVEEWVYIVKSMQQITIDRQGKVISKGGFGEQDRDENTVWVQWNKRRDEARQKEIQDPLQKN